MNKDPYQILSITVMGHEVAKLDVYKLIGRGYNSGVFDAYMGRLRIGGQLPIESNTFYHVAELKAWAASLMTVKFTEL